MHRFIAGLIFGLILGAIITGAYSQPVVVGKPGFLMLWTVTYRGREVCSDPWVWVDLMEIECD